MNGTAADRAFGLAFLAVVATAIVALLAGYGVPVGVGAVAGLLLGGIAGFVGVLWLTRGSGRSITIGSTSWSSPDGDRPSDADFAHLREMSELTEVDLGRALAVEPEMAVVEAKGIAIEIVSATVHEGGVRLDVEVRTSPGITPTGHMARVSASDDLGTAYRAAGRGTGTLQPARYDVTIVPRPPMSARRLTVSVEALVDPFPGASRYLAGPWVFSIPLPKVE